jgi:nucleotide-binding universal stress UspA family protein
MRRKNGLIKLRQQQIRIKINLEEFIVAKRSILSTILDHAEEQNINLIVVGTTGRLGIKKVLPGSVALGLVTCALCPVLVIK